MKITHWNRHNRRKIGKYYRKLFFMNFLKFTRKNHLSQFGLDSFIHPFFLLLFFYYYTIAMEWIGFWMVMNIFFFLFNWLWFVGIGKTLPLCELPGFFFFFGVCANIDFIFVHVKFHGGDVSRLFDYSSV